MTTLRSLPLGTRFRYPDSGKTAILLSVGESGARVVFDDSGRKVAFAVDRGDGTGDEVTFDAPGKAVLVSAGSEVVPVAPDSA